MYMGKLLTRILKITFRRHLSFQFWDTDPHRKYVRDPKVWPKSEIQTIRSDAESPKSAFEFFMYSIIV